MGCIKGISHSLPPRYSITFNHGYKQPRVAPRVAPRGKPRVKPRVAPRVAPRGKPRVKPNGEATPTYTRGVWGEYTPDTPEENYNFRGSDSTH